MECIEELEAREPDHNNIQKNVPDYSCQVNAVTEAGAIREPPAMDPVVLCQMYQNLDQKQAFVCFEVRDWCIMHGFHLNPVQFFFFSLMAILGKSHLLRGISDTAQTTKTS